MSEPVSLSTPLSLSTHCRVALNDQVVVRVAGPTAEAFLHGQFSQDINDVTATTAPRAAACTHKGRAYCLTRLVRQGDDVLFALPAALADDVVAHLDKYRMLFRGTTMGVDADARVVGLLGEAAAIAIAGAHATTLTEADAAMTLGTHRLIRTQSTAEGLPRYELWLTGDVSTALESALATLPECSVTTWQASEIAAGVVNLTLTSKDAYIPQMLNWQHVGGIHFKKGCYTGQEVVARMHFLGQLKKSLFRIAIHGADTLPAPGQALHLDDRQAGEIINAVRYQDGTVEALAVLRHVAATDKLRLDGSDARIEVKPLPYSVPERETVKPTADDPADESTDT